MLANIDKSKVYFDALNKSDINLLDSGLFVILLKFVGYSVSKLSGLNFLKMFITYISKAKNKKIVGYGGKIKFDRNKPDGTMSKLMDNSRIRKLNWKNKIDLEHGIKEVYSQFKK